MYIICFLNVLCYFTNFLLRSFLILIENQRQLCVTLLINLAMKMKWIVSKKYKHSPDWYGSLAWALSYKPKGHWFDSWSGYMPGLWAKLPFGIVGEATDLINVFLAHWHFCPFSPSLHLFLKINKIFKIYISIL